MFVWVILLLLFFVGFLGFGTFLLSFISVFRRFLFPFIIPVFHPSFPFVELSN